MYHISISIRLYISQQQTGSILPGWIPSMADACMTKHESDHHKRRDDGATLSVLHTASCFQLLHAYRRSAFLFFFFWVLSFFYKCQTKLVRWEAAKQGKIKPRILNLGTPYFQQSDPVVPVLGGHRFNSPVWQYELWFEDCDTMSRVSPSHFLLHIPPSSHK